MVKWTIPENTERLLAVILAANPSLKLDYHLMAAIFSNGATYDALQNHLRRYVKQAEQLREEARARGVEIPCPGTPRTPRGVAKPSSSGTKARRTYSYATPTRRRARGQGLMEAVFGNGDPAAEDKGDEVKEGGDVIVIEDDDSDDDVKIVETPGSVAGSGGSLKKCKEEKVECKFEYGMPGLSKFTEAVRTKQEHTALAAVAAFGGRDVCSVIVDDPFGYPTPGLCDVDDLYGEV
ncbi:hypothetical protein BDV25DRAFT_137882 [Aspergillus avenaceus]|uniref:Uncharacterized protein n=1 Tax=Aspergillus avenaceus TaxID=36643 RepID=A0A5N6U1C7_ASPAV|nr:hypothetical protein BDV25DRAFT_137882 [Aspergillus avenaceus]